MSTDFGDTTFPTARKQHRCEWCGEPIEAHARHVKFSGKWEGDFQSWRMHHECFDVADASEGFTPYEHSRGGE